MSNFRKFKVSAILAIATALLGLLFAGCYSDPYAVDYGNSVYSPQPQQQTIYYDTGFHDPWYHRSYYGRPYYGRPYYGHPMRW